MSRHPLDTEYDAIDRYARADRAEAEAAARFDADKDMISSLRSSTCKKESTPEMSEWQPIETAPEGELLLWYCPKAHRGTPSCEVLMVFRDGANVDFWTNGGPNAGDDIDFEASATPTHWMPLPVPPRPEPR